MKNQSVYECFECGFQNPKPYGKCPQCGNWNSMVSVSPSDSLRSEAEPVVAAVSLASVSESETARIDSGLAEFNTVLGGGIVPNSVVLIGGEPGIGKSTLLLEVAASLAAGGKRVLYYSGEESAGQIKARAVRLGVNTELVSLLTMAALEDLQAAVQSLHPEYMIVDSIQTLYSNQLSALPGSPSALKAMTAEIVKLAKQNNLAAFIIGHITKEGQIAGPKILEHLVDAVLYFQGEMQNDLRILRAEKNRFGSVNEIGVFQMTGVGLQAVADPSQAFRQHGVDWSPGTALFPAMNGLRSILTEVQALVVDTPLIGNPRRIALGYDAYRLAMLISIIEKKLHLPFYKSDVFLNMAGGMAVRDPACDLAVCAALISSHRNLVLQADAVFIGEIGLTGETRPAANLDRRIREAARHGIKHFFLPPAQIQGIQPGLRVSALKNINELFTTIKGEY